MSLTSVQSDFGTNQNKSTLSDQEAAEISLRTYTKGLDDIRVFIGSEKVTYNVIETIEDRSTGLNGYVLENAETKEIVISFEGSKKFLDWTGNFDAFILGGENYTEPKNKNQFTSADKVVKTYIEKHGGENITFVGHSLGGALAEYFAVKYNSNAVTFAAPDIYNILTKEQKKQADNGDFKSNIISYTYSDDPISSFANKSIGSIYYMNDPREDDFEITFENHGIANYLNDDMFDDKGYYHPTILMDENLLGALVLSPLALKNSGEYDFPIVIKAAIMEDFVTGVKDNVRRIENTKKALENFWDFYSDEMKALKTKYDLKAGMDEFDMLSPLDVEEVFENLAKEQWKDVPLFFYRYEFEELIELIKNLHSDTDEIAFNMNKMSEELETTDKLLSQWLRF